MGGERNAFWVLWVNLKKRDHLEDLDIDGRMILTLAIKK
jgi:hypothetical protein